MALLPLALAGLLPLWVVALLCGLFALGVRSARWQEARLLAGLLVISAGAALKVLALDFSDPVAVINLGLLFLVQTVAFIALYHASQAVEEGRGWGALLVLGLGLLAPQPLLLAALVGAQLARPAADDRALNASRQPGRSAAVWLGGTLLALTVLSLALPRSGVVWGHLLPARVAAPVTDEKPDPGPPLPTDPPTDPDTPTRTPAEFPVPFQVTFSDTALQGVLTLSPLLGFLMIVVAAVALLRAQARAQRGTPPTLPEMLMIAGLVLTTLLWTLIAALLGSGGGGGVSGGQEPLSAPDRLLNALKRAAPGREIDVSAVMWGVWLLLLLSVLLLAAAAWFVLRRAAPPEQSARPAEAQAEALATDPPPLHRVRAAYRAADLALRDAGLGRADTETPTAYAARLGAAFPALAAPLSTLTRLYEPVRYGGRVTEEHAAQAESALGDVQATLPTLPRPDLDPDPA